MEVSPGLGTPSYGSTAQGSGELQSVHANLANKLHPHHYLRALFNHSQLEWKNEEGALFVNYSVVFKKVGEWWSLIAKIT